MRCGTIGSCQSAATSEIVKRCWSRVLTHVDGGHGAIASVQTFTFTLISAASLFRLYNPPTAIFVSEAALLARPPVFTAWCYA